MAIVRWDPFRDLMNLQDEVNSLFRRSFFRGAETPAAAETAAVWAPALDMHESEDKLTVEVELPGLEAKDIDISLDDGILHIRGERKFASDVKEENYHRIERAYGYFERNVPLPRKVDQDKVSASVQGGVLRIELPKAEEAKPKQIPIKVEEEK
ncbi:MAG: Hsp20/alpha crystallin family protein [Actinomycetota bacterium]|nr:Hsp20/alpha crystallin family protein [Actinomycetota bacterium]MDD5667779.1 Hsp20/alpha crystallin family protein [Actinomycetota bacterium]